MPNPAVTYTFTNGTIADGPQVSTNFTDLIASLTDGTKDLTVLSVTGTTGTFTTLVNSQLLAPAATALLFYQAAAPSGWTRSVAVNDKFVRVVSAGSPGTTGGTHAASIDIGSHTHAGPSHTHTGPSHTHAEGTLFALIGEETGGTGRITLFTSGDTFTGSDRWATGGIGMDGTNSGSSNAVDVQGTTAAGGTGNTGASGTGNTGIGSIGAGGYAYADVMVATKN